MKTNRGDFYEVKKFLQKTSKSGFANSEKFLQKTSRGDFYEVKKFLMKPYKLFVLLLMTASLMAAPTVRQLFNVQTIKVKKQSISQRIKNYGYVMSDESRIYDISPRFGGYVVELYADKIYKKVKKGEPLVKVYSPEVFKAKDEYLNTYKYTKKRPSQGMLSSARLKLELLGVSKNEIEAVITSGIAAPNTTIYAPADGYVFIKSIQQGTAFKEKQKLFEIVNLDEVWVEAKLFEEERERLSMTKRYELNFKGLDKTYHSSNTLLYPKLDPKIATLTLRIRVQNPEHKLFPGMFASVISLKDESKKLTLPTTAVIRKDGKHYVFIVGEFEGEYEPLEIEAKEIDAKTYAVIDGLQEGDEVVNNALFMMDSDAQINGLY